MHTLRFLAVPAVVALLIALAACGNDDDANGQVATDPDEENELAETLLLTLDDFPSGWTATPDDDDDSDNPFDEHCPTPEGTAGVSGSAETDEFSSDEFNMVAHFVALFVDEDRAGDVVGDFRDVIECIVDAIEDGHLDEDDVRFTGAELSPVSFPDLGDRREAHRVEMSIEAVGTDIEFNFYMDVVIVQTGRVVMQIMTLDAFSPFDSAMLEELATIAVNRAENVPAYGEAAVATTDDDADTTADEPADTPTATPEPEPTATPTPEAAGTSRSAPAPIGEPITVAGWEIVVNSVTPDATQAVLAENQFNDPPADGNQFFIANISATYYGDEESASFFSDVSLSALGPSAVAYVDYSDRCGVIPDELDSFRDVFEGGTVSGNICWQIQSSDAGELLMYAEAAFSFDDDSRYWFALYE